MYKTRLTLEAQSGLHVRNNHMPFVEGEELASELFLTGQKAFYP